MRPGRVLDTDRPRKARIFLHLALVEKLHLTGKRSTPFDKPM
jgi:hypothetical protein